MSNNAARARRIKPKDASQRVVGSRRTLPKIQQGSSVPDHNFDQYIDDVVNRLLATRFSPVLPSIDADQSTLSNDLELPTTAPDSAIIVLLLPGNTKTEYKHMEDGKLALFLW